MIHHPGRTTLQVQPLTADQLNEGRSCCQRHRTVVPMYRGGFSSLVGQFRCLDISYRCWVSDHFRLESHHPGRRNRGAISKIQETAATSPVAPSREDHVNITSGWREARKRRSASQPSKTRSHLVASGPTRVNETHDTLRRVASFWALPSGLATRACLCLCSF